MLAKSLSSLVLGILISSQALAQSDGLLLGEPAYGGTGCPAGTAAVTVSPDQSAISILFDNYVAEAGRSIGKRLDRKSCNITIPVKVPSGYTVSIFQVDYRGFASVPSGARARFDAEYFWAGSRGPKISRMFMGPYDDLYTLTDRLLATTLVWTPCGADVNLRINSSMLVQAGRSNHDVLATVDSADVSNGLIYHLRWQRCGGRSDRGGFIL